MKNVVIAFTILVVAAFLGFEAGRRHSNVQKHVSPPRSRIANIEYVRQKLETLGNYIAANEEYRHAHLVSIQTGLDSTGTVLITLLEPKGANPASSEAKVHNLRIGPSSIVEKQQNPRTETTQDGRRRVILPSQ